MTLAFPQQGIYVFVRMSAFLRSLPGYTSFQFPCLFVLSMERQEKASNMFQDVSIKMFQVTYHHSFIRCMRCTVFGSIFCHCLPSESLESTSLLRWTAVCKGSAHFVLVRPQMPMVFPWPFGDIRENLGMSLVWSIGINPGFFLFRLPWAGADSRG